MTILNKEKISLKSISQNIPNNHKKLIINYIQKFELIYNSNKSTQKI